MKYKYFDKGDRLIAESDSPIQFNVARFPVWKNLKPVIEAEEKVILGEEKVEEEKVEERPRRRRGSRNNREDN